MTEVKSTKKNEKMYWLTGLLFFVLLGTGIASIFFLFQINNELKDIVEEDMPITEMITRLTIHKLEQTYWLERAVRHAENATLGNENDEDDMRLLQEAKAQFKEITAKVNEEIVNASSMSKEAQKVAHGEHVVKELRHIEESLSAIQKKYAVYNKHADELFALFARGKISEAESVFNEIETLEDEFNQTLEAFLFASEKFTRHSLSSIGESEDTAIIVIASIISISLLFTAVVLFFKAIFAVFRKVTTPRNWR
jgi:methyl-accepting chemotaxis protein